MPSGPKKRKAAKKKQFKNFNDSHHHHEVDKLEDGLSQISVTVGSTQKVGNQEEGNIEIDNGSKSKSSHDRSSSGSHCSDDESRVIVKEVVESVQPIESLSKIIARDVGDSTIGTSSVLNSDKPVDSPLEFVNDATKIKDKAYLIGEEKVVLYESALNDKCSTSDIIDESVLVENMAQKSPSPEENAASTNDGADHVNEPEILQEAYDKEPLLASSTVAVQKTSWKGCCGIFELFSSSHRN